MMTNPDEDYWLMLRASEQEEKNAAALQIKAIEDVEPLDGQFGVHPKKSVPDPLHAPLFGQPDPTEAEIARYGDVESVPPLRTYAIVDAAKMPYLLTSQLEEAELCHQSLFQGKTQEKLKEHAPYLVELQDDNFTRRLFTTDKAMGLWEKELGVYIRSREPFDLIRKHFRKFTRIQDEKGKWFYVRFWEASVISELVRSERQDLRLTFSPTLFPDRVTIASWIVCSGRRCVILRQAPKTAPAGALQKLEPQTKELLRQAKCRADLSKLAGKVVEKVSTHQIPNKDSLYLRLMEKGEIYLGIGFRKREHLTMLMVWEALLGPDFLESYAEGAARVIVNDSKSAVEALNRLKALMREIAE